FRLGIVRDSTMVRQVGRPQWQPLRLAAGLDDDESSPVAEPPLPTPQRKPARKLGVGASVPVPRPRAAAKPPTAAAARAYSSRVPPPVTVTRNETGETSRPQIPMATIT